MDPLKPVLELTPDLIESAEKFAYKEARKWCPKYIDHDDAVQDALLRLISKPPPFEPDRGARPSTFIYLVIQRAIGKYINRENKKHYDHFVQLDKMEAVSDGGDDDERNEPRTHIRMHRPADQRGSGWTVYDILEFIDNEESRALCRLVIECSSNISEAARRLESPEGRARYRLKKLTEGAIRHRLKVLGPKMLAGGFGPVSCGGKI